MSLTDSTGIPSASDKWPPLEYSLDIHVHKFRKLSIWWWENRRSHSVASYFASSSSCRENPYYIAFDTTCRIPKHY